MNSLIKKPSAWLPIVISLTALAFLLGYLAIFGIAESQGDEGAPACIFQMLMLTQALIAVFFTVKWIPQMPKQALQILALQIFAALVPIALIFYLEM